MRSIPSCFSVIFRVLAALVLLAGGPAVTHARLVNRWSFNDDAGNAPDGTNLGDSVSGAVATVRGTGSTFSGTALTLAGTTNGSHAAANLSGYVDLPNGIISSKANLTVEMWATPLSAQDWMPLFDFGRIYTWYASTGEITGTATVAPGYTEPSQNLMLTFCRGTDLSRQRMEMVLPGPFFVTVDSSLATAAGTPYHYVLTFTDGAGAFGAAGGQIAWYRNGVLVATGDAAFHLANLQDVNNWLGRSQYSGYSLANAAFNEFRIHDHAMTASQVAASYAAGPDTIPAPVLGADTATMHLGQKVRLAVLANDSGDINAATVEIVQPPLYGTAVPDSAGRILYAHTTGAPTTDSFTYRVSGAGGQSAATTVAISFAAGLRIANPALNVPAEPPSTTVQFVNMFSNYPVLGRPVGLASPPGDTRRLFICDLDGLVRVIPDVTVAVNATSVVLNLPALLATRVGESMNLGPYQECGLLGLAFHPNYATNGHFYLSYVVRKASDNTVWYQRLSRFTIPAAQRGQPAPVVDANSELVLIEQRDREPNHCGGDLHFGADGYLYYAVGDEGNPWDYLGNSQRIDLNFFSAMLRLDVDKLPGNPEPNPHVSVPTDAGVARYAVPADNPYVGATTFNGQPVVPGAVRTEFWAVGLRSPWRFSIDAPTGEIWLGDVGQDTYEELDLITRGANYGWNFMEASHDDTKPYWVTAQAPPGVTLTPPVYEYPHTWTSGGAANHKGNSITGGLVYRGTRIASLTGAYIFGDYVSGNIWALTRPGGVVTVQRITGQSRIAAFGSDPSNGDLLAVNHGGEIYRLVTASTSVNYPATLSATGLFADLTDLAPAPGVLPYEPNLAFWSDYAIKRRWFAIPDGTSRMTWSRDGAWTFPAGQIWVKHFDLETERGNPASPKKRIETRLLVKTATGCYGVSYRWNAAGTEATLVGDGGDEFAVNITVGGAPHAQQWRIPSRAQCVSCHSPQAGHALSFTTRQVNRAHTIHGFAGNQLDLLRDGGYFANSPESPNVLPRHLRPDETRLDGTDWPLEARARSYFAVNCAYCHAGAGGTAPTPWDGRPELTLAQTGLINGAVGNNGGNPLNKLVVPGDTAHSVVLNRMAAANGFTRMPPLGSNELDPVNIALITNWITQALPGRQSYAQWRLAQFGSGVTPEGDPDWDADGDGRTNLDEFVGGTQPLNTSSFLVSQITATGPNLTLSFHVPADRSFQVETSTDLTTWSLWDIPGNHGLPQPAGPISLTAPLISPQQFFRLRLWEN